MLGYSSSGRDVDVSLKVVTETRRSIKAKPTAKPTKTTKSAETAKPADTKNLGGNEPNGAAVPVAK